MASIKIGGGEIIIGGYAEYEINKRQYRNDTARDAQRYPPLVYPSHIVNNVFIQQHNGVTGGAIGNSAQLILQDLQDKLRAIEEKCYLDKTITSIEIPAITADQAAKTLADYMSSKSIYKRLQLLYDLCDVTLPKNIDLDPALLPVSRNDAKALRELEHKLIPVLNNLESALADILSRLQREVGSIS